MPTTSRGKRNRDPCDGEKNGEAKLSIRQRAYKVRSYVNGQSKDGSQYTNYSLTVPSDIAEALPEGIAFSPRMTEEGLLYEPVSNVTPKIELPSWARQDANGNGDSK